MGLFGQGCYRSAASRPLPSACRRDCISFRGEPCCCVFDPKGMCFNRTGAEESDGCVEEEEEAIL